MRKTTARAALAALLIVAAALATGTLRAGDEKADEAAKEKKVRKLLKLSGAHENAALQYEAMLTQFQMSPGLPKGFTEKFKAMCKPDDLVELLVGPYKSNLADEDLDGIIAFYESPPGKALGKAQPKIQKDNMAATATWGMETSMKVMMALQNDKGGKKGKKADDEDDSDKPGKPGKKEMEDDER